MLAFIFIMKKTIKQLTNDIINQNFGDEMHNNIIGLYEYPFEDFLATSAEDLENMLIAISNVINHVKEEGIKNDLCSWLEFLREPDAETTRDLLLGYIMSSLWTDNANESIYTLRDDDFCKDSTDTESEVSFWHYVIDGFRDGYNGNFFLFWTMEQNFGWVIKNMQRSYEETELFKMFLERENFFFMPYPCDYLMFYFKHRDERYVTDIVKFVRFYRRRYVLANVNLYMKQKLTQNQKNGRKDYRFCKDILLYDFYKETKDEGNRIVGVGNALLYPENECVLLCSNFPLNIRAISTPKSLYMDNWDEKIRTPLCIEKTNVDNKNSILYSDKAKTYWGKLIAAGFVDNFYQPLKTTSRSQMTYIAECFSRKLNITKKWKMFEEFWGKKNFAQEPNKIKNRGGKVPRSKEIDKIFD